MRKSCWGDSPTRDVGAQNRVSAPTRSALLTQPPVAVQRGAPKTVRRTTSEAKLAGARPPREASPAKVASDGQHNDDDDDDPKPGRHVILSSGACRLYDEPTRIRKRVRAYAAMGTARARASAHARGARMRAMHARARVKLPVSRRVRGVALASVALRFGEPLGLRGASGLIRSVAPSIVLVLRHCPGGSGRGIARADARTCRCRSSARRSSGSGSHTGPPGRSRAAGHPC
jgi:hypothetical protein